MARHGTSPARSVIDQVTLLRARWMCLPTIEPLAITE